MSDDIEQVVAMKTFCLTRADYYQVSSRLKGKLSNFVTGADTVDMLDMMMIGCDGAQAGIMALGRQKRSRFNIVFIEVPTSVLPEFVLPFD